MSTRNDNGVGTSATVGGSAMNTDSTCTNGGLDGFASSNRGYSFVGVERARKSESGGRGSFGAQNEE